MEIGLSDPDGSLSYREENMIDPLTVYQVRNVSDEQEHLHTSFPSLRSAYEGMEKNMHQGNDRQIS